MPFQMSAVVRLRHQLLTMIPAVLAIGTAIGQTLRGDSLTTALRAGGYVIVMRHASSPRTAPAAGLTNPDNLQQERQLDESGRASARDFGEALRRLRIPIGKVLSSPTYRAAQTVRLARLGEPETHPELGDSGASMVSESDGKRGAWLRSRAAEPPRPGSNTVIVTHYPNLMEAFANAASDLADGEALVLHPDGRGNAPIVARVKIEEWTKLQAVP